MSVCLFCSIFSGRFGRVIVTSKDGNKNMLRASIWKELRLLDGIIRNLTVYYEEEYFKYEDICAKWMTECFQNDILNLDYVIEDVSLTGAIDYRPTGRFGSRLFWFAYLGRGFSPYRSSKSPKTAVRR